jgi:hypothetical protein
MKQMTCREFDEVVHGVARLELLDVALREEAFEHVSRCSACASRLVAARALAETTTDAASALREQQAPRGMEGTLLVAFRQHHRRRKWLRSFEWAAAGSMAAALAIFLWISWIGVNGPASAPPGNGVSSRSNAPMEAMGPNSSEQGGLDAELFEEAPNTASGETDTVRDFVPVPYAGAMGPGDTGMIVRVQLTPASLAQLGYPVAATPDEGLIRADVLITEDGRPRAVRVVP